jgi:hypothetical protein
MLGACSPNYFARSTLQGLIMAALCALDVAVAQINDQTIIPGGWRDGSRPGALNPSYPYPIVLELNIWLRCHYITLLVRDGHKDVTFTPCDIVPEKIKCRGAGFGQSMSVTRPPAGEDADAGAPQLP